MIKTSNTPIIHETSSGTKNQYRRQQPTDKNNSRMDPKPKNKKDDYTRTNYGSRNEQPLNNTNQNNEEMSTNHVDEKTDDKKNNT